MSAFAEFHFMPRNALQCCMQPVAVAAVFGPSANAIDQMETVSTPTPTSISVPTQFQFQFTTTTQTCEHKIEIAKTLVAFWTSTPSSHPLEPLKGHGQGQQQAKEQEQEKGQLEVEALISEPC